MNTKKVLLWIIPLLIIPSLLFTILLQRSFENQKQAGWIAEHLNGREVKDILFDAQHRAWVATNKGVSVFDGDGWTTHILESGGLTSDRVCQIVLDHQGQIWASTNRGVSVFDGTGWSRTSYTSENWSLLVEQGIARIALDQQGQIWIYYPKGRTAGVSLFDGQSWITYTVDNSGLVSNRITTIAFDDQNRAWIGTWEGLNVFDGETWTTYTAENSGLLHNHIFTIAFDRQDRAWIGAEGELNVFDGQNRAWIGVHEGVNVLDGASGEMVLRDSKYTIYDVILAREQVWLIPTQSRSRGIRIFTGGTWLNCTSESSVLPDSMITAHAVDHEGQIWIGSGKGIRVLDPVEARPLSDSAVAMSRFLSWGGHLFLPVIVIGLWLGLWRDALPGIGAGIGVGLFIFLLGVIGTGSGEPLLVLGCVGTITGIVGGLVGSIILRRRKAALSEEAAPAGNLASTITGVLGGGGCAIAGVLVIAACVISSCAAFMLFYASFLQQ